MMLLIAAGEFCIQWIHLYVEQMFGTVDARTFAMLACSTIC